MKNYNIKNSPSRKRKFIAPLVIVLLVAVGVVAGLELTNTTHWFHKPADQVITTVGGSSEENPQSSTSKNVKLPPKKPTENTGRIIGTGTDTRGQANESTSPSQWVTAKSGNITVKQPIVNSVLKNGAVVAGTAKVSEVQFRLLDDETGVIARGVLHVVDGKFSGKMNFSAHGVNGRLDVFSTTPDGAERNEVQIAIRF